MNRSYHLSRRKLLKALGIAGTGAGFAFAGNPLRRLLAANGDEVISDANRNLLFVFCARGGASLVDALLPVAASEVSDPATAARINAYPDAQIGQVSGTPFRYVINPLGPIGGGGIAQLIVDYDTRDFIVQHSADMVVMQASASSVSHLVGQTAR